MHKLTITAIAAALGLAWAVLPVGAQDTMKDKAERTGDKIENKAERTGDKIENKAERAGDKIEDKADAKGDTMGDKLDRAVDKTKAKTREMKNKVSEKMDRGDTKNAQQALQAKGYNPGPIDGVHGPRTSAAIRDFQKAEGLTVTGQLDGDTRARLMADSGQGTAAAPAASPTTVSPAPTPSSSVGSPSATPVTPEKTQKP
jgi:peptidoglycan hydrolase-like protein with peptidoglycan-binding domain